MNSTRKRFTFIWKIENYSMFPHQKNEKLESPSFVVESLNKTKWHLGLFPKGVYRDETNTYLSLFLERNDWDTNKIASKLRYSFVLESVNKEFEISFSSKTTTIDIESKGRGRVKFLEFKTVYDNKKLYLPQDVLTIRCHIWHLKEICNIPAINIEYSALTNYFENRSYAKTTIDVQKRVLTWPITNISRLEKNPNKISLYLANSLADSPALKLSFYIDKTLKTVHERAKIEIRQVKSSTENGLFVKCKITVVCADKNVQISHEDSYLFSSNLGEIWHFPSFIVVNNIVGKYAYVDDTMYLQCEFAFSHKGSISSSELPMYMPTAFNGKECFESTELSKNVGALFESKKFCDIEIRAGDKTFSCHKFVLCAQSPVFCAMFQNDMKETKTGVVEIIDLEPQVLEKLLNFLYFEVIEDKLTVEDICELYSAADKYEVSTLQRRCSLLLLSKLCVENLCRVLITADTHQDNFLRTHINNFLSIHSRNIFHSPEWKTFMVDNPTLSREIMVKICMEEPYF